MKRTTISAYLVAASVITIAAAAAPQFGAFEITRSAFSAGGGSVSGALDYSVRAAIGRYDSHGQMAGADYTLRGGFIQPPDEPIDCPGDSDGNLIVDLADLLEVISNWGSDGSAGGDVNDDAAVNLADLLEVISNWGSICE